MDEVSREKVRELACRLRAAGAAPKTIHNVIRVLSAIFTLAYEEKPLPFNPARNPSKLVKLRKGRRADVYSHAEEILILAKVRADLPHWYPFVLLLFRAGLREGEAVALEPGDLDLRGRSVQIERNYTAGHLEDSPKDGEDRSVELALDLVETLKGHLALQEAEATAANQPRPRWLFTTPAGEIIRSNNFRDRIWRPTLKALGIRYRCVHAIRHTYATRLIMHGANLVYVQKQLGHSSIKITVDLYTHWIEAAERGHTREVDRLMLGPDGGTSGGTQRTGETEVLANTGECMG
jgi:integrase